MTTAPPPFTLIRRLPLVACLGLGLLVAPLTRAAGAVAIEPALRDQLREVLTRHLDQLLGPDGRAKSLKGKTAHGQEAYAFYQLYELTGKAAYRQVALDLAERVLSQMRATPHGVLPIKEKEKAGGETIIGGGPPAMGFYTARVAYVLHREGGRSRDLEYLAQVVDRYPWNEDGWWASTIDIKTGEPKEPLAKPSIINKTAAMAMAAGILSKYVAETAPELSARLRRKADQCVYRRILPAQEVDGFWHYSLSGNDPRDKDVFGYFLLTTNVLMDLQQFHEAYRTPELEAALRRARDFAARCIAPMTAPNQGKSCREHATPGTPEQYSARKDGKRGFALGRILVGGGLPDEGGKILAEAVRYFPVGNAGQDGAHAADPTALLLAAGR